MKTTILTDTSGLIYGAGLPFKDTAPLLVREVDGPLPGNCNTHYYYNAVSGKIEPRQTPLSLDEFHLMASTGELRKRVVRRLMGTLLAEKDSLVALGEDVSQVTQKIADLAAKKEGLKE